MSPPRVANARSVGVKGAAAASGGVQATPGARLTDGAPPALDGGAEAHPVASSATATP